MSNTNNVDLRWKVESTYNQVPTTTSGYQSLRYTSHSLASNNTFVDSDQIRSDGNVADVPRVNVGSGGAVESEFSSGHFEEWMEYVMRADSTWSGTNSPVTCTGADASGALTFSFGSSTGAAVGDIVLAQGFGGTDLNGASADWANRAWIVTAINNPSANDVQVSTPLGVTPGDLTIPAGTVFGTFQVGDSITNGTTENSIIIEAKYEDIARWSYWKGLVIDSWDFNMPLDSIITHTWNFQGHPEVWLQASDDSPAAVPNSPVMTASANFHSLEMGGVNYDTTSWTHSLGVGVRLNRVAGTEGPFNFGTGRTSLTGTFQVYNETVPQSIKNAFVANTDQDDLVASWLDNDGYGYALHVPNPRITSFSNPVGGADDDVFTDIEWRTYLKDESWTVRLHRFTNV